MKWILCTDRLPPVAFDPEMNYWHSVPVMSDNGMIRSRRMLWSHDGVRMSWGLCYGGEPFRWIEPDAEPDWMP